MEKCKNSEDLCFKSVETKAKTCKDCLYYDKLCFYALLPSELNLCKDFTNKADVVSVVRCKDCKHFSKYNGYERGECRLFMELISSMKLNDYCSYGERKCDNDL